MSLPDKKYRTPTQRRSLERVENILDAAMTLFGEQGVANVTLLEIARKANLTPSSIYQYFPDKNAIVLTLAIQHKEKLQDFVSSFSPDISDIDDVKKYSRTLVRFYRKYLKLNRGWIAIVDHINNSSQLSEIGHQQRKSYALIMREKLKHLVSIEQYEPLEKICYWWGHTAHASLCLELFNAESVIDIEEFICSAFTERISMLIP